jgi:hypothetical protein
MSAPVRSSASKNMGTYRLTFDHDEVVELLRSAVEREGNQVAFAKRHRLNRSYLNRILNGKREASPPVLKALGLRNVYAKADDRDRLIAGRFYPALQKISKTYSSARREGSNRRNAPCV